MFPMAEAATDGRVLTARRLLERVFRSVETPLAFRLWDGTLARVGPGDDPGFTIVFRSRPAFRRCVRRPTPLRFGEAYIGGEVDLEGDLFAAMRAANVLERLRVPLATKLRALAETLRI